MTTLTLKDKAAAVRNQLKAAGIAKGVSVRGKYAGCEESIRVTIKDPAIDKREVERVARKWEAVETDHTYDVLAGGNTFVFVDYEYGCFDEVRESYMARALALLAEAARPCHERGRLFPVDGESGLFMSDKAIRGNGSRLHGGYAPAVAEALYKWERFGTVAL